MHSYDEKEPPLDPPREPSRFWCAICGMWEDLADMSRCEDCIMRPWVCAECVEPHRRQNHAPEPLDATTRYQHALEEIRRIVDGAYALAADRRLIADICREALA